MKIDLMSISGHKIYGPKGNTHAKRVLSSGLGPSTLVLRTLFAVLVLILESYISFVDVLVLKYISMYFEYLM